MHKYALHFVVKCQTPGRIREGTEEKKTLQKGTVFLNQLFCILIQISLDNES